MAPSRSDSSWIAEGSLGVGERAKRPCVGADKLAAEELLELDSERVLLAILLVGEKAERPCVGADKLESEELLELDSERVLLAFLLDGPISSSLSDHEETSPRASMTGMLGPDMAKIERLNKVIIHDNMA